VGTKLLLLALLPVCCLAVVVVVSAVSDYWQAHRLSVYRSQIRLSFTFAALAVDIDHERRAAALVSVDPGHASEELLAGYEHATTQGFAQALAQARRVPAPVDVVGALGAARRQRQALVLQLAGGALAPAQAITGYSVIAQNLLGVAGSLGGAAPSSEAARSAAAYGALLEAIEASSRERIYVATQLAPRDRQPPASDPWDGLQSAELSTFRENASGPLVGELDAVLFSPAGVAVQQFREELAAGPVRAVHNMHLERWLALAGDRIDGLRAVAGAAVRRLDAVVTSELDSAEATALRNLALLLCFLALVTALALALRRSIAGPLREVSAAARGLARGDIATHVQYTSRDEIGDVAAAFRDVHASAERLVEEIQASNRAVGENQLDHRSDPGGLEGVWSQVLAGVNDTMASFAQLQAQRHHAEREVARIFELSLDLLCVIGFDGCFRRVNPAFERTLGYPQAALLARPAFETAHPDDVQRLREVWPELMHGRETARVEVRHLCVDGSLRWLQWSARAAPEEGLVYATARDVTDSRRAAEEQAALRRMATLVAQGAAPETVFDAVAEEVAKVLPGIDLARIGRYLPDRSVEFVGGWSGFGPADWVGRTARLGGHNVASAVFETGQPARVDHLEDDGAPLTAIALSSGARSSAGVPIEIEGQVWGLMIVGSVQQQGLPLGIELDLAGFTELVATAIANTQAREELAASRARLVTSADETRRRIVRDLHDATQQRLVHTIVTLKLARNKQEADQGPARELVKEALDQAEQANRELRELSHGILPSVLSRGGLAAGVADLTARLRVPVEVKVTRERLAGQLEATAYFLIAEALTNVVKHSGAQRARVEAKIVAGTLELEVRDDGSGGADPEGSGLRGLSDRVLALGGRMRVESPQGQGTRLIATVPIPNRMGPRPPAPWNAVPERGTGHTRGRLTPG
jgi:PAS domain S-box-containing protein